MITVHRNGPVGTSPAGSTATTVPTISAANDHARNPGRALDRASAGDWRRHHVELADHAQIPSVGSRGRIRPEIHL